MQFKYKFQAIKNPSQKKHVGRQVYLIILICMSSLPFTTGCKKFIEVKAPITSINAANVYSSDATAAAVLTAIYSKMSNNTFISTGFGNTSISFLTGLSSDELNLVSGFSNTSAVQYFRNDLDATSNILDFWSRIYPIIYACNSAIEGINTSNSLTPSVKQQLLGEAKFSRAFCYFYLINLYGDLPLAITSDWQVNSGLNRSPQVDVWKLIISDLKDAQQLLNEGYVKADAMTVYPVGSAERVRPNKSVATALLARAYLFTRDYINAEMESTKVIGNSASYGLTPLNSVFLKNSNEAIWQLQRTLFGGNNTADAQVFILPASGPSQSFPLYLNSGLLNVFENNDQRKVNWVGKDTVGSTIYYYPYKYKIYDPNVSASEYNMVLRLGEQYLIRAEARAQQNNIAGAQADLNAIRTRAGLANTTAGDKTSLLAAVLHERQAELFTEWGHRWFDLKRTNNIDAVMTPITLTKGGTWQTTDQLYPIPLSELQKAPQLVQNAGY